MSSTKTKWESIALYGIIALMAIGFLWTIIALLTGPKVKDPFAAEEGVAAPRVRQVRENPRMYHQNLTIHGIDSVASPLADFESKNSDHEKLIPLVPDSFTGPGGQTDPFLDSHVSMYRPNFKSQEEEDLLADEDKEESSGWGWLADDIAKRRSDKKEEAGVEEDEAREEEDERLAQEKENERREKADESNPLYFMDTIFNSDSEKEDPYMRSVMKEDDPSERGSEQRSDDYDDGDDAYTDNAVSSWDQSSNDRSEDALAIRDPFAADRGTSSTFGGQEWGMSSGEDRFSGIDYNADAGASRIIEAADAGAGRYADQSGYFASDSMFNSGGGYTPQGVNASRADSMFSGSGVFGGPSVSIVTPSANPSAGIGTSYRTPTPPSSSSIDRDRNDSGLSKPVTLPW